jgi:hypothetical protein
MKNPKYGENTHKKCKLCGSYLTLPSWTYCENGACETERKRATWKRTKEKKKLLITN